MADILIANREQAVDILQNRKYNDKITAVVSISDQHSAAPKPVKKLEKEKEKFVLILHFDDLEEEMLLNPRCKGMLPPQKKHVQAIIDHADDMLNSGGIILCHCNAGISRSAAAAFILKSIDLGEGHEKEALDELVASRNIISPNSLMVSIAQEILGDEWKLDDTLHAFRNHREPIYVVKNDAEETLDDMLNKYSNIPMIGKGLIKRI